MDTNQVARRRLIIAAICLVVCFVSALALHVIAPKERIARAVAESLRSALGDSLTVGSVKVESLKKIVLHDVHYLRKDDMPLEARIESVVVRLQYPLADIVLGRWSPVSLVSRIELFRPTLAYTPSPGQDAPVGLDFERILSAIAAHPDLRELSAVLEISDGRFVASGLFPEADEITFTDVTAQVVASEGTTYTFELTSACERLAGAPLEIEGFLDVNRRSYGASIAATSVPVTDMALLFRSIMPELGSLGCSGGFSDFRLDFGERAADRFFRVEGTFEDAVVALSASGLEFRGASGSFWATPEGRSDRDGNQLGGPGPALSGELTADSMEVKISSQQSSTTLALDNSIVSFVAGSDDSGSLLAYGTAGAGRLSAGQVAMTDVVCEFRYLDSTLDFTEVAGYLMGGELGGQLSISFLKDGVFGNGHARIRGLKSKEIPVDGISDMIDAAFDGTASLTLSPARGYGLVGKLTALTPRVAGLSFDDATATFTCENGSVDVDSLVVSLHGTRLVLKGDADKQGQADVPATESEDGPDPSVRGASS